MRKNTIFVAVRSVKFYDDIVSFMIFILEVINEMKFNKISKENYNEEEG